MKTIERNEGPQVYNHREEDLPRIASQWGLPEIFDNLCSHVDIEEHHLPIPENTALFYARFPFPLPVLTAQRVQLEIEAHHSIFYDKRFALLTVSRRDPRVIFTNQTLDDLRVLEFEDAQGDIVGVYYPSRNVLIASDWSHYGCVSDFRRFWEAIRPYVARVKPRPRPSRPRRRYSITVGADPEFELVDPMDGVISADRVIDGSTGTKIGLDGAMYQVELRPDPGTPEDVVRSLGELLREFSIRYPNYDLSPIGDAFPIGCHIHIGVDGKAFEPPVGLIEMLDDFIGRPLSELNGGARGSYASLGSYRIQPHGFEYRTPPAAAVADPEIARIVFKIAHNVTDFYLNREDPIEYETPPTVEDYMRIAGLTREEAEAFLDYCSREDPAPSLLAAWGLPAPKPPRARVINRDDWHRDIFNDLREAIVEALAKAKLLCRRKIILYGLHKDRGFVASIPIEGMDLLENPPYRLIQPSGLWIGLPWDVRVDPEVYREWKDRIVKGILDAICHYCEEEE